MWPYQHDMPPAKETTVNHLEEGGLDAFLNDTLNSYAPVYPCIPTNYLINSRPEFDPSDAGKCSRHITLRFDSCQWFQCSGRGYVPSSARPWVYAVPPVYAELEGSRCAGQHRPSCCSLRQTSRSAARPPTIWPAQGRQS